MDTISGEFVIGKLLGYSESPWANDPTKFNRRVGIQTGSYQDQFGVQHPNVVSVDVQFDDVPAVASQCQNLNGSYVMVPVITSARKGGRDGAFLGRFMPKKSQIMPVTEYFKIYKTATQGS